MYQNGGNNNRAVLERLEKRYRDHFRHKAHKKPQKRKGQCNIFNTETKVFEWIYIP